MAPAKKGGFFSPCYTHSTLYRTKHFNFRNLSLEAREGAGDSYFHFRKAKAEAQKGEVTDPGLELGGVRMFKSLHPVLEGMIIIFPCYHCQHHHLHRGYGHA